MTADAFYLGHDRLIALGQLAILRGYGGYRGAERGDDDDRTARGNLTTEERCIGLHRDLLQTSTSHRGEVVLHDGEHLGVDRVVGLLRQGGILHEDLRLRGLHLGIGVDRDDRLLVVGNDDYLLLGSIGRRSGDVAHELDELLLDLIHIDITYNHYGLILGTIPSSVEILQIRVLEALQAIEVTDQVALGIARTLTQGLEHLHHRTPLGVVTRAQLLRDYTALRVDLLGLQSDEVRPVVQNQEGRVDHALALYGDIRDVVAGLVPRGVGVQVGTELYADRLQVLDHLLTGQVLRAVEGHVLQEVGQTLLVYLLLNGTYVVQDVEVGLVLRLLVVADVVRHAVLQRALTYGCILRNRLHGVEPLRGGTHRKECGCDP